jgi:hypothetical protein
MDTSGAKSDVSVSLIIECPFLVQGGQSDLAGETSDNHVYQISVSDP